MAGARQSSVTATEPLDDARVLVVEARYYDDIADALLSGARKVIEAAGASCSVITVPGALEIPGAIAMALGGEMVPGGIAFFGDRTDAERADGAASIINAMSAEASIMARCTGKTDVRNIEPEDLRAITLASSKAFGIPLAGQKRGTVIEAAE